MYLNKLEIFGFKSFAQKSVFKFEDGLTAIIGPNGCGKSNIVDAIRWVLGEQRPTVLRCDRMENIIFNGTATRKPLSISEVSMFIENTKQILPSEYNEIKITRRLYRSGESEYLLNNQQVRLLDIIDMFADTGMGADAYSVIELKMVEQILSENAEERRRLFEEAAGIKKYKIRRKSALRKLDITRQELVRLEDILSEVKKNVNSLSRQVGKARRYHTINDELKKKEYIITQLKIRAYESDLRPLEMEYEQIKRSKETLTTGVQAEEAQIEKLQAQVVDMERSYREIANRLQEADDQIHEFQKDRQLRLQKIESLRERISSDQKDIETQQQRIKDLEAEKEQNSKVVKETREKMSQVQEEYKKSLDEHQKTETVYRSVRDEYQNFVQNNLQKFRQTDENKETFQKIKIEKENLRQNLESKQESRRELQESLKKKEETFTSKQENLQHQKTNYETEQKELHQLQEKIQELERNQNQLRAEINQVEGQYERLKNKRDFLENVIENYEGFSESVQFVMSSKSEFTGLIDILLNLVNCKEEHRNAVESYLDDIENHLVVEDLDSARNILQQIRENEKGRVTLVPLSFLNTNQNSSQSDAPILKEKIISIKDVVTFDKKFEGLFNLLFKDVYLVDNLDSAIRAHQENPNLIYVTNSGEIVRNSGNITGGIASNGFSLLGRKDQLSETCKELEMIGQKLEEKNADLNQIINEHQQKKGEYNNRSEQQKKVEREILVGEKETDQIGFEISRIKESMYIVEREIQSISERKKRLSVEEEQLMPKIQELDEDIKTYQLKEKEILQDQKTQEEKLQQMSETTQKLQIEFLKLTSREKELGQKSEFIDQNKNDALNFIDLREKSIQQSEKEIKNLMNQSEGEEEQLNSAYEKRDLIETQRNELEKRLNNLKSTIQNQDVELKKQQRLLNEARERLQKLELQIRELQVKKTSMVEQLQEKYGKKSDEFEQEKIDPSLTLQQVQGEIEELREKLERLGDVNPLAIKEHEKEKERLDFLNSQKEDLVSAEDQLMETIHKLNTTARKEFMNAFSQIRENFQKVFREFFQNGEADLHLIESRDPLEANIDFSINHKGRQLNTLALLSAGEKTLTAISLLFAIYLVKPSPFCILDEVDAPLDDVNIGRYTDAIRRFSRDTQFILVTHNKRTIEATHSLYGITMEEQGVSKVVSVRLD